MAHGLDDWRELAADLLEEEQEILSLDPLQRPRPDVRTVFEVISAIADDADMTGRDAPSWSYTPKLAAALLDLLHAYPGEGTHTGDLLKKAFDESSETLYASITLLNQVFFTYHLLKYIRKAGFGSLEDLIASARHAEDR